LQSEPEILKEIENLLYANYRKKNYSYQPIEHPHFKNFNIKNNDLPKKSKIIREHLNGNVVITLGCNLGYLSRHLSKNRFYVVGVDHSPRPKQIHELLTSLGLPKFKFVNKTVYKFMIGNPTTYRPCSVTAMALFHWFLKTKKAYTELVNTVAPWIRNNARQFFFEYCPLFGKQKYKDFNKRDWINFWMKHGGFKTHREIYVSPRMKRTIILFEKEFPDINYKDDIIYIDPKTIKYHATGYDDIKLWYRGAGYRGIKKVIGKGDWDLMKKYPIEEQLVHKQMVARFVNKKPWKDIKGQSVHQERRSDAMYRSMKRVGYRSPANSWDEVCVAIGRDNTRFLMNGRHRVAIAQILNTKRIPVRVLLVHPEYKADWIKGRNFLKVY